MSFLTVPARTSRPLIALLVMLLVLPVTQLLGAGPAQAAPGVASGEVIDALGEPVEGVDVTVRDATSGGVVTSATSNAAGLYGLDLDEGSYRIEYVKAGFATTSYGEGDPLILVVDDEGQVFVDDEPMEDNLLDVVILAATQLHELGGLVRSSTAPLSGITVDAHPADDPDTTVGTATTSGSGSYTLMLPLGRYSLSYADAAGTYLPTWYDGAEPGAEITVDDGGSILVGEGPSGCTSLCDVTMTAATAGTEYPIAGDVLDANGDPVADIAVEVTAVGPDGDSGTGTSDEEGSYSVAVLPGTYHVAFAGAGFVASPYTGDSGQGRAAVTVANNGSLSVTPTEELFGNRLNPTTLTSVSYLVGGRVVTASAPSEPLVGITVRAFLEGDRTDPVGQATSDTDGAYGLDLPVGSYDLQLVDAEDDGLDYLVTWLGGDDPLPVTVGQGGAITYDGARITTLPTVAMVLAPADATHDVTGLVVDALGEPIGSVAVTATPTGSTPADQDETTMTSPAGVSRGTYTLSLEVGTYRLSYDGGAAFRDATYDGDGESAATVTVGGTGVISVGVSEVVGGVLYDVELAGTTTYPLSGKVANTLQGITVQVYAEDETTPGSQVATVTTDSGGSYTSNLTIGSYVLQFSGTVDEVLYGTRWYGDGASPGTPVQVGQGGFVSVDGVPGALEDVLMSAATADSTYPLAASVVDANYEALSGVLVTAVAISGGATTDTATSDVDGLVLLDLTPGTYEVSYEKAGVYKKTYYLDPEGEIGTERARIVVAISGTMRIGATTLTEGLDEQVLVNTTRHTVTGTVVTEAATGLGGITVQALLEGETGAAATVTSGPGGGYTLPLLVGTYTLRFTDTDVAAPTYAVSYLGGETPSLVKVATSGQVEVDDAPVTGPLSPVTMRQVASDVTYTLRGYVYDENYEALNGAVVLAQPVSGTPVGNAVSGTSGNDGATGDGGVYRLQVRPGKYQLRFSKAGYQTTWLTTYDDLTRSVTLTVASNGVITGPGLDLVGGVIDDVQLLLPAPQLLSAPRLTGRLEVGQKVTTTFGTWSPSVTGPAFRDYTYIEWFLDGKSADRYASGYSYQNFQVPLVAVNKKLTYRITIEDPEATRAPALFTSKTLVVPKARSSIKGTFTKGKLTVTVKVPGLSRPTGKITLLRGKKKVAQGTLVAKKKGVVVLNVSKLKKGKHRLTIIYAGTLTVKGAKKVIKITR